MEKNNRYSERNARKRLAGYIIGSILFSGCSGPVTTEEIYTEYPGPYYENDVYYYDGYRHEGDHHEHHEGHEHHEHHEGHGGHGRGH